MPAFFLEMVMERGHQKDPPPMGHLEVPDLHDDRQGLQDEDAADDGEQKFLLDDDRDGTQGAAQGQRSDIAHEHLRRIGIIPEKAEAGTDDGAAEDRQFAAAGDIGDLQVLGEYQVTGEIGEDQVDRGGDDRRSGRQAVEPSVRLTAFEAPTMTMMAKMT